MEAIRIENLTKKYKDVTAVDDLSLSVAEGELMRICSGKALPAMPPP